MHAHRSTLPLVIVLLAAAALVVVGCGDKKGVSAAKPAATAKGATKPTADTALTQAVGTKLAPLVAAGCEYGVYTEEDAVHVDSAADLKWKTFPPASGTHFPQWTDFGIYDKPVNLGYVVHNMEHGGVVAFIGKGVTSDQSGIIDGLVTKGTKWVVVPEKDLSGLAVNAWAKSLSCSPAALAKVSSADLASGVEAWYSAVQSTGSASEKDLPAYHGGLSDPKPTKNISVAAPF